MRAMRADWRSTVRRMLRWRYLPAVLLALVLAAVAWLLMPRRTVDVVSVDGQHHWDQSEAPPQRGIVWQPARQIEVPVTDADAGDSLIRPLLAEGGSVLYFTLQKPGRGSDIYRSPFVRGAWQPAEAVAELNTEADDIGPVISADGNVLVFYSNRPGGLGGFDIYTAQRRGTGWTRPRNAGPPVNTPAHEFDPALTPDGRTLFFASNRTAQMQQLADQAEASDHQWAATLRAKQGQQQFDLYVARRAADGGTWERARPLEAVNRPDADEGAPFVSPSGAFLYFASDRSARPGDRRNLDIYRARIDGEEVAGAENLGAGVNTSANETEPALSPEGFRILFSSDRAARDDQAESGRQYALYDSTATEVFQRSGWDTSAISAVASRWWWFVLGLLGAALLAALIWYLREVSMKRATVPAFFLTALIIHVLLGIGSFFFYFGEAILDMVRKRTGETVVATEVFRDPRHQSHEAGMESYEKIADLKSLESFQPDAPPRTVTEMPNVPVPTSTPLPTLPIRLTAEVPPNRIVATLPVPRAVTAERPNDRRPRVRREVAEDRIDSEPIEPVPPMPTPIPERLAMNVPRREPAPLPAENIPRPSRPAAADLPTKVPAPAMRADRAVDEPLPSAANRVPANLNRIVASTFDRIDAPRLTPEDVPSPSPQSDREPEPEALAMNLPRRGMNTPAARAPSTPATKRPIAADPTPFPSRGTAEPAGDATVPNPSAGSLVTTPIERSSPGAVANMDAPRLLPEPIPAAPVSGGVGSADAAVRLAMNVDRKSTGAAEAVVVPAVPNHPGPDRALPDAANLQAVRDAASESITLAGASNQPGATERAAPVSIGPDQPEPIAPEAVVGRDVAASKAESGPPVAGIEMGIDRAPLEVASLPVRMPGHIGGRHDANNPRLVVGELGAEAADTLPSTDPLASRMVGRRARAPRVLYAEDAIGLQSMLMRRQVDEPTKRELVIASGGSDKNLTAIRRGLAWLAAHQADDGHWSLNDFRKQCKGHQCQGPGRRRSDTAATGLALLPFLGDGHTHTTGNYRDTVGRGLRWLVARQKEDGDLYSGGDGNSWMYSHAIGAIAICEAYGMSRDAELRTPCQQAVNFILAAQHAEGGWRYRPKERGDTSVVGWQIMALKSGQIADLEVPQKTFDDAKGFLERVGSDQGRFGYQGRGAATPALTAEGLLCLEYLGAEHDDPRLGAGAKYMLDRLPKAGRDTSYYWYYGSQAMYHLHGQDWQTWNTAASDVLVTTQRTDGPMSGTWDPKDRWEGEGGRIYATALRLLILEVPYRHLPLYRPLAE